MEGINKCTRWFLSMKPKDSFLKRLDVSTKHKATNQHFMFGGHNTKTLGMMLYSGNEVEFMKNQFENRLTKLDDDGKAEFYFENPRPETKLAKLNGPIVDQYLKTERKRNRIFEAAMHFWQALRECDKDGNDAIDKDELRKALQNGIFTEHDATVLFGKTYSVDQIFQDMDTNKDGSVGGVLNEFY
ncbi:uncharacterized protein LOC106158505 [Lingula anatina]|uniref:Uncharacterized protein LOC106158505 n=1 Tax=Lingula anatina TaxID=7574 RepID=A0A1S3HVD0_LINAN|nr:uncharacterized protein LOC106158505 [Lingula anatina]|eukprot:XP_013389983.1 uncharacterized protein LOC106158505 [Lingula anatina]